MSFDSPLIANVGMLKSRTSDAATSSCVDSGFDAHSAICAPPSRSAIIRFAVSVVTCRHAATRIPASGCVLMNCLRMVASTGMDCAAHSIRFLPISARARSFTSQGIGAVAFMVFNFSESLEIYTRAALAGCAASFRAAALSVASHVKESSVRPKWPNAAVLR